VFKKNNVLEFSFSELGSPETQKLLLQLPKEQEVTIIFEGDETSFPGFLFTLKDHFLNAHYAIRLTRKTKIGAFSKVVPFWIFTQLHALPVAFDVNDANTLTCGETKKAVAKLLEKGARATPLPYRDFKVETLQADEAEVIKWQSRTSEDPFLSVIIPTRNYEGFLINVLRHLFDQSLARSQYEVILVDDGGTDQSFEKAKMLLGPLSSEINFKYIYNPRGAGKENHFRAGHCRNIGIEHSRGKWVLFLDSDILVKRNFLEDLIAQSKTADVIQCPRLHIQPAHSSQDTAIEKLSDRDVYLEEKDYWGPFFSSPNWSDIPSGWRYTCTYCLAMSREALDAVGPFRQVFTSYGFEDTELGYRLHKAGYKFLLWKENVLHLTPPKEKSRYYNSMLKKQILLSKTGKTFFLSTLDLDVFNMFRIYMGGEPRWQQIIYDYYRK
jgi:glycosyltransferase involved in cell wall biosynthesis